MRPWAICQISDLHLDSPPGDAAPDHQPGETYRIVPALKSLVRYLGIRGIVATGDLIHRGSDPHIHYPGLLAALGKLDVPIHLLCGNHDDRHAMAGLLPSAWSSDRPYFQYAAELGEVTLLALDSADETGGSQGRLCPRRLRWLEQQLRRLGPRPTALAMHHPPLRPGTPGLPDRMAMARPDVDRLEELLLAHPQVGCILCGHMHHSMHFRFAHAMVCVAPSLAYQYRYSPIPLDQDPALARVDGHPGLQVLQWDGRLGFVAHTLRIGPDGVLF